MKKMTLKNKFHNTEVMVVVPDNIASSAGEAWFFIQDQVYGASHPTEAAKARLRRVRNALCGRTGCTCGVVR